MATIEILGWKENYVGFTGWDDHARSELKKRLRRAINACPAEIKRLARQIDARQPVSLEGVRDEAVESVCQILETTGAEVRVSFSRSSIPAMLSRLPPRRV
jgi:predicted metal-dependent peptidase